MNVIKERLKKLKINQSEFAMQCGVTPVQVSKWANGHSRMPVYAESILRLLESSGGDIYLNKLTQLANLLADGHYTICKFTNNYRVSLGTPADREFIDKMAEGKTMNEAIDNLLKRFKDIAYT